MAQESGVSNKLIHSKARVPKTWQYYRRRGLAGYMASHFQVEPKGRQLLEAFERHLALALVTPPLMLDSGDFDEADHQRYLREVEEIETREIWVPKGGNKFGRLERGTRDLRRRSMRDIFFLCPYADHYWTHAYWTTCTAQPSGTAAYTEQIHHYSRLCNARIPGSLVDDGPRYPLPRPHEYFVAQAERDDSLDGVGALTLILGVSREEHWDDLFQRSFLGLLDVFSRVSSVPPFATFGEGFARDMIHLAMGDSPIPRSIPRDKLATRIKQNRELVRLATSRGVFGHDMSVPQVSPDSQLHLINHAESVGSARFANALRQWSGDDRVPSLVAEYIAAFDCLGA